MPLEEVQPLCPNCQSPLEKMSGKFGEFWGCKQYKDCGFKGYSVKGERPKDKPNKTEQVDPMLMVLDETRKTNERLDKMGDWLIEKFDELNKKLK